MISKKQRQPFYFLPFIVFVLALCFLFSLLLTMKEDVFFSGDAGLKYLMIKQIANGGDYAVLHLQSPAWVSNIWSQGFYPFKAPFIYNAPRGNIVSFPPAFQWLSSRLYTLFGYKGMYVIPFCSIAGLWLWFILMMQRINIQPLVISLLFFLLVFCSPITMYGAIYWEHSFAIALFFGGVVFLTLQPVSVLTGAVSGLISGMSVWFRPEMLLLCLLIMIIVISNNNKRENKTNVVFIISLLAVIAAFFIFNFNVYGSILGAHSYQLLEPAEHKNYLVEKINISLHLNARLVIYFPFIILFYGLCMYFFKSKWQLPELVKQLTVIVILFLLMVPFALPNAGGKQWGPRYLLPVIPIVIIAMGVTFNHFNIKKINKWIWIIVVLVATYSFYINTFLAHHTLHDDYAYRVKPALDYLKAHDCDVLIVQNQYIAQEFAALFETKRIFLAENQQNFNRLSLLLKSDGIKKLMYVSHDSNFIMLPDNLITHSPHLKKIGDYYVGEYEVK